MPNFIKNNFNQAYVEKLTSSDVSDQLIYFTSKCITSNNENFIFISDRTGHPNIYSFNFANKIEKKLTDNKEEFLQTYQYFNGQKKT